MATEIHQADPESSAASEGRPIAEKDNIVQADASSDLEGHIYEESKRLVADRAEATELTPVEAFKWNVEGDQSPCECSAPEA